MADVVLYERGYRHARNLIEQGNVDKTAPWSISPEDENELLGDPPDWKKYASWHLGERPGADEETKARWAFPFGKKGKVYRRGLIAAKSRAAQQGYTDIAKAADKLLQMVDGEEGSRTKVVQAQRQAAFAVIGGVSWVQLLPLGRVRTLDGREFVFDAESGRQVLEAFEARANDLVVDYDHATLNPFTSPTPAAGWIVALELRLPEEGRPEGPEHGLWGKVEWTPRAAQMLQEREYRYLSPVVKLSNDDPPRVLELLGAGLVNDPAIDGMAAAASRQHDVALNRSASSETEEPDTNVPAGQTKGPAGNGGRDMLLEKLGYASEEEALEAFERLRASAQELEELRRKAREAEKDVAFERLKAEGILRSDEEAAFASKLWDLSRELFEQWVKLPRGTPPPQGKLEPGVDKEVEKVDMMARDANEAALLKRAMEIRKQLGLAPDKALLAAAREMEG